MTGAEIEAFYDTRTSTLTYVVFDRDTSDAVLIDSVRDFDPASGRVWHESAEAVRDFLQGNALQLRLILETHVHADHLSAAPYFKRLYPHAPVCISARIERVQETFKQVFALDEAFATDGRQFDRLLRDGETLAAGSLSVEVIATPGHTPACTSFLIGDVVFTGDAMFMPDMGTGRCDFPMGSADDLFSSISNGLYRLPDATRVCVGHDYRPGGRELAWESTIAEQKAGNIQLRGDTTRAEFIAFRTERDATLGAPTLLYASVQVNVDAGRLPAADDLGRRFLKTPLTVD